MPGTTKPDRRMSFCSPHDLLKMEIVKITCFCRKSNPHLLTFRSDAGCQWRGDGKPL